MLKELRFPAEQLYYSTLSGWNQYRLTGTSCQWKEAEQYPEAVHQRTGECFHLRPLEGKYHAEQYAYYTEHPAPVQFVWPLDAAAKPHAKQYYGVFRNLPADKMQSLADFVTRRNVMEEPEDARCAAEYARRILCDAAALYADGYAYYGWQAERIYISGNGLRYDFSSSTDRIQPEKAYPSDGRSKLYCDPAKAAFGADLDYFAVAVLLFYILIGKYPYDGRLMDGVGAATELEQAAWYEAYRKNCVFIFDRNDHRNSVGTFAHEAKFGQRWEALPADVRAVFTETFCGRSAGRMTLSPTELTERCAFFRGE